MNVEPAPKGAQPDSVDSIVRPEKLSQQSTPPEKIARWGIGLATPFLIVGGTLGAAVIFILHYSLDAHLDGKPASGFWSQTTTHRLENALATIFALLFTASAGVSLCQVVSVFFSPSTSSSFANRKETAVLVPRPQ
jgi:hypothetical protein